MFWKSGLGFVFLCVGSVAWAQFETSEVLGTVRDPSQLPVAKAAVTLANQATGIESKTETDESGNYDFFNVKLGRYTVIVEKQGFSKFTATDAVVNVGLPSTIAQGNALVTNLRQHVHSLYAQDDWRVTPKLTVNVGLRWEFATPIWDRENYWSNFDPVTNSPQPAVADHRGLEPGRAQLGRAVVGCAASPAGSELRTDHLG